MQGDDIRAYLNLTQDARDLALALEMIGHHLDDYYEKEGNEQSEQASSTLRRISAVFEGYVDVIIRHSGRAERKINGTVTPGTKSTDTWTL